MKKFFTKFYVLKNKFTNNKKYFTESDREKFIILFKSSNIELSNFYNELIQIYQKDKEFNLINSLLIKYNPKKIEDYIKGFYEDEVVEDNKLKNEILYKYGTFLYEEKEFKLSQLFFEPIQTKNPELRVNVLEKLIVLYIKKEEYEKAKEKLEEILKFYPLNGYYNFLMAKVLFKMYDYENSILYSKVSIKNNYIESVYEIGITYFEMSENLKSLACLLEYEKYDENNSLKTCYYIAQNYFILGDSINSINSFHKCIENNINVEYSILKLIDIYHDIQQYEDCLDVIDKYSFKGNPKTVEVEIDCLMQLDKYEETIDLIDLILKVDISNYDVFIKFKSYCLFQIGKFEECALLNIDLVKNKDIDSFIITAKCFYQLNDFSTAINYFNLALLVKKDHPQILLLKCRCLIKIKLYDDAIKILNKILNIEKGNIEVYYLKYQAYLNKNVLDLAISNLEIYLNLIENKDDELYVFLLNHYLVSKKYYMVITKSDLPFPAKLSPLVKCFVAYSYFKMNQKEKGLNVLKESLSKFPKSFDLIKSWEKKILENIEI
jgi:tetratricopeptide (TPR) repeat protein